MKKFLFSTLCILFIITFKIDAQNYNHAIVINQTFNSDTIIIPFKGNRITGINISGHVVFHSDTSFIRILVNDNIGSKFMIYETYPMLENTNSFNFTQECEESCFFNDFLPNKLIIQICDASLTITNIQWSDVKFSDVSKLSNQAKTLKNQKKLCAIQEYIKNNHLIWIAEETDFSKLLYHEKAKILGDKYKSFGIEYYKKGIYSPFPPNRNQTTSYDYVDNFDWRSRHGACFSNSPYYDNDLDSTGWITPVVCQGKGCWLNNEFICNIDSITCVDIMGGDYRTAGTCWIFGPTAQIEALTNLYYNDHIDVNLSEQYIVCRENKLYPYFCSEAYKYYINEGVPNESCLPYSASLDNCNDLCANPEERIWIDAWHEYYYGLTHNDVKEFLIQNGPLNTIYMNHPWGFLRHAMLLVGWGTIDEDVIYNIVGTPIDPNNPPSSDWYGLTYWIYKQSLGPGIYDKGFFYMLHWNDQVPAVYVVPPHITSLNRTEANIRCRDEDGDGYYSWGLGTKPSHCPLCPSQPDGDDSNPSLGTLNTAGQCTIIDSYTASFEKGWNNWIQVNTDNIDWWRHKGPSGTHYTGHTGPNAAQDGSYYIYIFSSCNGCYPNKKAIIESPPINFEKYCLSQIEFYYHQNIFLYGNEDPSAKLELQISYDHGQTWIKKYWQKKGDQGDQWNKEVVRFPSTVNKLRFIATTGESFYSDIALDNITISPVLLDDQSIIINSNTIWERDSSIYCNVIINGNKSLTIKNSTISLHKDSKITILPGGKLILDASIMTTICDIEPWQGIITSSEVDNYGNIIKGQVELKNGAVIENAVCAISTAGFNNYASGGFILGEDASFQNNGKDIAFTQNGNGCLKRSQFICNSSNINEHITINNTSGIDFQGCLFTNGNTSGTAIYSMDGQFTVREYCTHYSYINNCSYCSGTLTPSSFSGFTCAIDANNSQTSRTFTVKNTTFNNNTFSIHANAVNNYTVTENSFNLNGNCQIGLFSENCSGYHIEADTFYRTTMPSTSSMPWGMTLNNSGIANNKIYRNVFSKLPVAINCDGTNGKKTSAKSSGLQFSCNHFEYNKNDIYVRSGLIHPYQGANSKGSDNKFSNGATYNIKNANTPISYWYSGVEYKPYTYSSNVTLFPSAAANPCSSELCDPGLPRNGSRDLATDWETYNALDRWYQSTMQQFINNGYDVILDSIAINPNYQVSNDILYAAQTMMDSLLLIQQQMTDISDGVLQQLLMDTVSFSRSETNLQLVINWLRRVYTPVAKYDLVETNYQLGDYETAQFVLHQIPTWFEMDENETAEYQNFTEFYNFRNSIRLSGRDWSQMTESEIAQLQILAENNTGRSSSMAKGVLCFFYDICYEQEEIRDREISNPVFAKAPTTQTSITVSNLKVYPNPTRDVIHFEWIQPENGFISIKIFNVMGQLINSVSKSDAVGGKQYFELQMNEHPNGIYYYRIETGSKTMNGKIVKM